MKSMLHAAAAALLLFGLGSAQAQDGDQDAQMQAFLASLNFRSGAVQVPEANATLSVTEGFRYLGQADARRVLEDFWGNPPDETVLGMLVPQSDDLGSEHSWAVVLTWSADGHVSDSDAAEIDYAELLADLQEETRDSNDELSEAGYPTVQLHGWAQPPSYDAVDKRLHWAKELEFEGHDGRTLNYDIRVLGREGYLSLNAIADMRDLDRVNAGMGEVLGMARFNEGHRYADFNGSTDRTAAYGLAALVGGGMAAKTGLLAKLGLLLAKFWKLALIGVLGLGALGRKLLGKREGNNTVS